MPFRPRRPLLPAAAPGGAAEPSPSPPPALRSRPRAPAPRGDEPAERVLTPVLPPQAALAAPGPVEAGMLEKFELEEEGECPALPRAPPLRPGPAAGSPPREAARPARLPGRRHRRRGASGASAAARGASAGDAEGPRMGAPFVLSSLNPRGSQVSCSRQCSSRRVRAGYPRVMLRVHPVENANCPLICVCAKTAAGRVAL